MYTVCALLTQKEASVVSATVEQESFQFDDKSEREFNRISLEERSKFEKETCE